MPMMCDPQTRAKAIRLVRDHVGDYASECDVIRATASRLGMNPETLRKWIHQDEIDHGDVTEPPRLRRGRSASSSSRTPSSRWSIEILKAATSFFVRESDPRSHR
jgi:transposase